MADIVINASLISTSDIRANRCGIFWASTSVGYSIFLDSSADLKYSKTTDGGQNWGAAVNVVTGNIRNFDSWADWQTPSDAGTKIHMAYVDADTDDIRYVYLDTDGDSVGGDDQIEACQGTGSIQDLFSGKVRNFISITKTVGGNIAVSVHYQDSNQTNFYSFYTSPDAATWTLKTTPWEASPDGLLLFPGNEADNQDIWGIFWDTTANEISLKTFDDSGNSWSEQSISGSMADGLSDNTTNMDGAIRSSDGHLVFAAWSEWNTATADLMVWDINGAGSITAKTNVISNEDDAVSVSVFIDPTTDNIYVSYLGDGSLRFFADALYQVSQDGGANWDGKVVLSDNAQDDLRWVSSGAIHPTGGGRFAPQWYNDDLVDLFSTYDNSIEIDVSIHDVVAVSITMAVSSPTTRSDKKGAEVTLVVLPEATMGMTIPVTIPLRVNSYNTVMNGLVGWWSLREEHYANGAELVTNGSMEADSGWEDHNSPAANVRSDEQAHSGIYSRKITLNGIGSFGGISSADEITFVVGKSYIITGWAYNLNMSNGERLVMDCTQFSAGAFSIYPNQGVWTQWSEVVVATETSGVILFYNYPTDVANANASFYIDDVSIQEAVFEDISGKGNDGTSANVPVFTNSPAGRPDGSMVFNGSSDKVTIATTEDLKLGTSLSVTCWAKRNVIDVRHDLFSFVNTDVSMQVLSDNTVRCSVLGGGNLTTGGLVDIDTNWHHYVMTYSVDTMIFYLDGAFVRSQAIGTIVNQNGNNWFGVSSDGVSNRFNGAIADGRVYNRPLTQGDITSIVETNPFITYYRSQHSPSVTLTVDAELDSSVRRRAITTLAVDMDAILNTKKPSSTSMVVTNPTSKTNATWGWLLIPDFQTWQGEWVAVTSYAIGDTVLYNDGALNHVFRSLTSHNVGNIPSTSVANWFRLYPEAWNK